VFTHVPEGWKRHGVNAWHGIDVSYGFGNQQSVSRFVYAIVDPLLTLNPDFTIKDPEIGWKDDWVSETLMNLQVQFAATGNPTGTHPRKWHKESFWPVYNERDLFLDIGMPLLVRSGFSTLMEKQPTRD